MNPEIYRTVLESLPLGVYLVDRNRQILFWNKEAERITGYLGQEVIGRFCHDRLLMHCDENQTVLCGCACPLAGTMHDGQPREAHVFLHHKDGQRIPVCVHAFPVRDESGTIIGSAECFDERSAYGAAGCGIRTKLDAVTGIPDRRAMREHIRAALETFTASQIPVGILCIAIDNLDHLRHVCGCQAVNAVLYAAAQTLAGDVRQGDVVGRWEEEGFAALIACANTADLMSCAQRLQRLVAMADVAWWGDRVSVTVSIGATMAREGDTLESLLLRAGEALAARLAEPGDAVLVV